jgi:hypothetical protein
MSLAKNEIAKRERSHTSKGFVHINGMGHGNKYSSNKMCPGKQFAYLSQAYHFLKNKVKTKHKVQSSFLVLISDSKQIITDNIIRSL